MEPRPGKNWPVRTAHWRKNQSNMRLQGLVELSTIFYGNTAVRAQIQEDIETTKKQRGKALRQREKARQFDRQREEIHPSYVVEALESLAPAARESLQLAEAIPDPEK